MKSIRKITLALVFCMILPLLVSCAEKRTTSRKPTEEGYYDGSTREKTPDQLPDDYTLKGKRIGVLYAGHIEDYCIGYEDVIDIVFSKIYERNIKVRERLDVDLDFVSTRTTEWGDVSPILSDRIYKQEDSEQIIMTTNNTVIQRKLFNLFLDLNESEWIDINEEWYSKDSIMELSVDNYYYRFLYGDINIGCLGSAGAIFYNKELYAQYINSANKDHLYDLVLDGTWTIEQFYSLTKHSHIIRSVDGENDIYGYSLFRSANPINYFAAGCDVTYYTRQKNGLPEIAINNERSIDFSGVLYSLLYENEGAWLFYPDMPGAEIGHEDDFPNRKVMFFLGGLSTVLQDNMREMEDDFGILPYPKWDEAQDKYITLMDNGSVLTGVPICIDYDFAMDEVSAVIEALSSESWRIVTLAFYETALKNNYSRDDIAAQMIDIITGQHDTVKSKLTKNFLYEYSWSLSNIGTIFHTLMNGKNKNFASTYDSIGPAAKNNLTTLIEDYIKASEE